MVKLIVVWALALLFTVYSLMLTLRVNFTAGTVVMWCIAAMLATYGLFGRHIDSFCRKGFGRVLKVAFFAGAAVYVGLFIFVAVSGYANSAKGNEKAVIVLGAGLRGERVGNVLLRRLTAAHGAWLRNPTAVLVVTGGQGVNETIPEALAMQRWLIAQGVPPELIVLEDKSHSTEENLLFSKALLAQRGIDANQPVAVVTNAFHCYRAGHYAKKLGFAAARTIPASMGASTLLPSYMREVLAILYMWVFRRQID